MEKHTIGKFISALRRSAGMTQKELGDKLFVSDKTVSRWERDECTPELNLIPAIADLFGVTADELLRGQRRSSEDTTPEAAARLKSRSDKQFQAMLHRRMTHFRNLSLVAAGIAAAGLIAACICDLVFYRALLGFFLGLVFLLFAAICQLCFTANAWLRPDEDDGDHAALMAHTNSRIASTTVTVLSLAVCVLAFLSPLLLVEATYGMVGSSWLLLGLIAVGIVLAAGHIAYTFWLRRLLERRGWLLPSEQTQRDKTLLKKVFLRTAAIMAALAVAVGALEASGWKWLAKAERFDDYASFTAYMDKTAHDEVLWNWPEEDGYSVRFTDSGWQVSEGPTGPVVTLGFFQVAQILDEDTTEPLATFFHCNSVEHIDHDGLPLRVYTEGAMDEAYALRHNIQTGLMAAMGLTAAAGTLFYLVRRKKNT